MKKNKVTAVITAYNAERYISRALDSVINQKNEECEIIVVNDASTDNTGDVVKRYGNRVKYIELKVNSGPAVGRTKGLFATETEYVAFLDADDYWKEDFASVMKNFLVKHSNLVAANCGYESRGYNGLVKNKPHLDQEDKIYYENGNTCTNFFKYWEKYDCVLTGTVLMRTEIAKKTDGQRADLRLTQDLEFWGYLATFGKWGFVPDILFITDEQILKPSERLKKFKKRFSFFKDLSIKSWKKRIEPNIRDPEKVQAFSNYLKNIYTTIAYAKAYTFSFLNSYQFAKNNKAQLKREGWGKALRLGIKLGPAAWPFICIGLRFREIFKAYFPLWRKTNRT